jgi:hypothetical protein
MKLFMIVGLLCSPFLENCYEFEKQDQLFETEEECKQQSEIVLENIMNIFINQNITVKVQVGCIEVPNGISS